MNRPFGILFSFFALLCLCMIAFTGGVHSSESDNPASSPGIDSQDIPFADVPETTHHFGKITPGGEYEHDFVVRNLGSANLEIKNVRVG